MPERDVDAREQRWPVTVDGDGSLRGIGDKTGSVPPAVVKRTGLRVIDVVPAARLAEVERELAEAVSLREEYARRYRVRGSALDDALVERDRAVDSECRTRAALDRAREALEWIRDHGATRGVDAADRARAALDALPAPTETTAAEDE